MNPAPIIVDLPQRSAADHGTIAAIQKAVREAKRWRDVVPAYAAAIRIHAGEMGAKSVWPVVHGCIRRRWAKSTLVRIKRAAWQAVSP